jgi:hypothetical protein
VPDLKTTFGTTTISQRFMLIFSCNPLFFVDARCAFTCSYASAMDAMCTTTQAIACQTKDAFARNDMDFDSSQEISLEPHAIPSRYMEEKHLT